MMKLYTLLHWNTFVKSRNDILGGNVLSFQLPLSSSRQQWKTRTSENFLMVFMSLRKLLLYRMN